MQLTSGIGPDSRSAAPDPWRSRVEHRVELRDVALACSAFLAVAALYALTAQTRMHGDGPGLGTFFLLPEREQGYNWAYLGACRLVARAAPWLPDADLLAPMKAVGVLAGAMGAAFALLVARAFGATRPQALLASLLLATAPGVWFYSTSIETHVLHFGAVALAAWITLALPWSRTWLALPLTAALMPLLFFTHQSGAFFGPGWMLLVAYASARKGKRLSAPFVVFVVGGVLLAALLCCHLWVNRLRLGVWTLSNELNEAQIAIHPNPHFSRRMFLEGWLFPLFLLVPAALLGVVALRRRALAAWTLALLLAPSTLFFLWWGLPERGGYITGVAPFYAVAAALALRVPRLPGRAGAIALLALQTAAGYGQVRQWDRGWDPAERAPAVRAALPRGGELISFLELTPVVEAYLGDVNERLGAVLMSEYHIKAEGGPAGFAEVVMKPGLDYALRVGLDVVVDTSYRRLYDLPVVRPRRPYLEAFERLVRERYRVTEIPHPYWSLMRIELASEESR